MQQVNRQWVQHPLPYSQPLKHCRTCHLNDQQNVDLPFHSTSFTPSPWCPKSASANSSRSSSSSSCCLWTSAKKKTNKTRSRLENLILKGPFFKTDQLKQIHTMCTFKPSTFCSHSAHAWVIPSHTLQADSSVPWLTCCEFTNGDL